MPLAKKASSKHKASKLPEATVKPLSREGGRREAPKKRVKLGEVATSVRQFFTGVWQELKKVHWPSRREVTVYTGVVLVVVTIVMLIIWIADSVYSQILRLIIK